ncbi:hypothetical protein EJ05DRAFT_137632 [Pseudovirgaria hyperparasitica]|uniref:Uncharacterized protein n=1 Tax=Pseudovirgaria hyperparasitica TaxID=470096 RepID=A0A6A6VYT1_9PEZI|nr:uncharacterized protein EJ05DRAFT_137632 [Pseudovirgaria hyperparasitica]KAF2754904.1 hypothetical protein EJ05DRAFT_137632 [Pseudovirgaria hyperparasitica]
MRPQAARIKSCHACMCIYRYTRTRRLREATDYIQCVICCFTLSFNFQIIHVDPYVADSLRLIGILAGTLASRFRCDVWSMPGCLTRPACPIQLCARDLA